MKLIILSILIFHSCLKPNLIGSSDVNSLSPNELPGTDTCNDAPHSVGNISYGGHCGNGELIPLTLVFLNSKNKRLSQDINDDANKTLEIMNEKFSHNSHDYLKFKLKEVYEVEDNAFHNSSCDGATMDALSDRYGSTDSMVMIFANDLVGSCAGVSWLWVFPKDKNSITLAEYDYPFVLNDFTPVVHEFAHSFGLPHTSNYYATDVNEYGAHSINHWIASGRSERRCQNDSIFFIDKNEASTSSRASNLNWNPYHNTMYPFFGDKVDAGFFTEGYDYGSSWVFDCWYDFAKKDF